MKKMKHTILLTFGLLLVAPMLYANDLEVALSSETAQFTLRSDSSIIGWGGADVGLGLFYNDVGDFLIQGSIMQLRNTDNASPLKLGVGVKAYAGTLDDITQDVFAFSLGGELRYTFPGAHPMSIYLQGYHAPKITSFADTESLTDINFGFQIEALPQTTAFIGVRRIRIDTDEVDNVRVDDKKVHFGVRLQF